MSNVAKTLRAFVFGAATLGALSLPAFGDTQKELIAAAKAIQKQLTAQDDASTALRAELAKIETQIQKLLQIDPTALQEKLKAAEVLITENQAEDAISEQVEALRNAVFAYQIRERDAFIAMLAQALKEADTGRGNKAHTTATLAHVLALRGVIEDAAGQTSVQAIDGQAKALTASLKSNAAIQSGDLIVPALPDLLQQLVTLEENTFLLALRRRTTTLDEMLEKPADVKFALRMSDFKTLTRLRDKINAILPSEAEKVQGMFIVSARYGRLSGPTSAGGSCDVRPTIVKSCQGKPDCDVPDTTFKAFCGGVDPAPFAQSQHKGLAVQYVCLNQTPAGWNALIRANPRNYAGHTQTATLRKSTDEIACAFP